MVPFLTAAALFHELWKRALAAQRYVDACRFATLRALTELMLPELQAEAMLGCYARILAAYPRRLDLRAVIVEMAELGLAPVELSGISDRLVVIVPVAAIMNVAARGFLEVALGETREAQRTALLQAARELLTDCEVLLAGTFLEKPETLVQPLDAPGPSSPKEADRLACQKHQAAARADLTEAGDRRDGAAADEADRRLDTWTLALDLHQGIETAREQLRARIAVLRPFLMLRGGTDFLAQCRRAIAEEQWGALVQTVNDLEADFVADHTLRWRSENGTLAPEPTGKQPPLPLPAHFDDGAPLL